MNKERLKQLEQFARDDPKDPFPVYALALEWAKTDALKAKELFDTILSDHPDYLPAYYQAGQLWFATGDADKARRILEKEIQKAAAAGQAKTLAELQSLYNELE